MVLELLQSEHLGPIINRIRSLWMGTKSRAHKPVWFLSIQRSFRKICKSHFSPQQWDVTDL